MFEQLVYRAINENDSMQEEQNCSKFHMTNCFSLLPVSAIMEYVSSDTNVWIDFSIIGCLELPFLLPYTYIMNSDAIEDELLSPSVLRDDLLGTVLWVWDYN